MAGAAQGGRAGCDAGGGHSRFAQLAAIQSMAPSFGVELRAVDVRDISEIERTLAAVARGPNNSLIVPAWADVTSGGLVSYGPERVDPYSSLGFAMAHVCSPLGPSDGHVGSTDDPPSDPCRSCSWCQRSTSAAI